MRCRPPIGLQPSTTGEPGGKETGRGVTHYIIAGGAYANVYAKLKARGFRLHWQSAPADQGARAKKASKTKYPCPECGQNAWAKPNALLICGACYEEDDTVISKMVAEEAAGA